MVRKTNMKTYIKVKMLAYKNIHPNKINNHFLILVIIQYFMPTNTQFCLIVLVLVQTVHKNYTAVGMIFDPFPHKDPLMMPQI